MGPRRSATASLGYLLLALHAPLLGAQEAPESAWGRNSPSQGRGSSGWLLESALRLTTAQTLFGRAEHVSKDELFLPGAPLAGESFMVNVLSLGYLYDFLQLESTSLGVGGLASTYDFASALNSAYGYRPTSFMVFVRVRL